MVANATIGQLLVNLKASGVQKATKLIGGFQKGFGAMAKKVGPQLEVLKDNFAKFGAVAALTLIKLIQASPRLRAQFEILNIRANEFLRTFGDALVPIVQDATKLIQELTAMWEGLDPEIQKSIIVGFQFVAVVSAIILVVGALVSLFNPLVRFMLSLGVVVAKLAFAWENDFLKIQTITTAVIEALTPLFNSVMTLITNLGGIFVWLFETIKPATDLLEFIISLGLAIIGSAFITLAELITGVVQKINDLLTTDFIGIFNDLLDEIGTIIEDIGSSFQTMPTAILTAITDLTAGLATLVVTAAKDIGTSFIDGIIAGILATIPLLEDTLGYVGEFFGGSLPERGPLQHIDVMGEDLGKFYLTGIDRGFQTNQTSNIFNRNFNIQHIDMNVEGNGGTGKSFLNRLDNDLRKTTIF